MESNRVVVQWASVATSIATLLVLVVFFILPIESSAVSSTPIPSSNKYWPTPHNQKSPPLTSVKFSSKLPSLPKPRYKSPPNYKSPPVYKSPSPLKYNFPPPSSPVYKSPSQLRISFPPPPPPKSPLSHSPSPSRSRSPSPSPPPLKYNFQPPSSPVYKSPSPLK